MVNGIGKDSSLARAGIEAALKRHSETVRSFAEQSKSVGTQPMAPTEASPGSGLLGSLSEIDKTMRRSDSVVEDVVTGKVADFHEAAMRMKEADLSLRFALEVRNKFVDAYREVMRMSV